MGRLSSGAPPRSLSDGRAPSSHNLGADHQRQQGGGSVDNTGGAAGDGNTRKRSLSASGHGQGRPRKMSKRKHRGTTPMRSVGSGASSSGFHGGGDRSGGEEANCPPGARCAAEAWPGPSVGVVMWAVELLWSPYTASMSTPASLTCWVPCCALQTCSTSYATAHLSACPGTGTDTQLRTTTLQVP